MTPRVSSAAVCGKYSLRLGFTDGTRRRVNLRPLLTGPVFEPLLDAGYFRRASVDPVAGTVVWPNGADVAPETLYAMALCPNRKRKRAPARSRRTTARS
jgi:hypothetical protein